MGLAGAPGLIAAHEHQTNTKAPAAQQGLSYTEPSTIEGHLKQNQGSRQMRAAKSPVLAPLGSNQ